MAEWLRRWTANPLFSARVGSNPTPIEFLEFAYGVYCKCLFHLYTIALVQEA